MEPVFWGKVDFRTGATYPLAHHHEDAEAVAAALVPCHPLVRTLAAAWGVPDPDAKDLLCFLAAVHDIGKYSDQHGYQQKCHAWLQGRSGRDVERVHHTDAAHALLAADRARLEALLGVGDTAEARRFLATATGHHGHASMAERRPGFAAKVLFSEPAREAAWAHIEAVARRRPGAVRVLRAIAEGTVAADSLSWPVAGFVVLCDWLASDQERFPLAGPRDPSRQAASAVERARVLPRSPNDAAPAAVVGHDILRPLQQAVLDVPVSKAPGTYILEAETGSGKTEAALVLAHRLLKEGATGVYWALPTQATSDALHGRLVPAARRLLQDVRPEDVVLAHGDRIRPEPASADDRGCASRRGGAWLADSLKKALLAPFAVGTLDQALLAALQVKHQCLRILGLVGKVLVVDEVHAYDNHELTILELLLEQHRAMGGHAILLSATLPSHLRNRLLGATVETNAYPIVSWNHAETGHLAIRDRMHKPKRVDVLHTEDAVLDVLEQAANEGKATAWIRNTVKEAAEAYDALGQRKVSATLFHARFTQADRSRIQAHVQTAGDDARPAGGRVVVATQVLEQSLDVDFDVLVTDLCPADLIVQRLGRLHRHARNASGTRRSGSDDERGEAVLYVHAPDRAPSEGLFSSWSRGTAFVYRDHALLWRTLETLRARPRFERLADLRDFVEDVYDPDAQVLDCFRKSHEQAAAERDARGQVGYWKTLRFEEGYATMTNVGEDTETATRIGEPGRQVVLTRGGKPIHGDWRTSRLRVPERLLKAHGKGLEEGLEPVLARQVEQGYVRAYDADAVGYTQERGWIG